MITVCRTKNNWVENLNQSLEDK